jgi:hypothetical protein
MKTDTAGEWLLPRAFKKESGEYIPNGYNIYIKEREVEKISKDEARIQEILNDPSSVFVGYSQEGYNLHIWINQGIKYYIEPELNIINKIEIMQPKESKTSWHFSISFAKSLIRMGACIGLLFSTGLFVLGMIIAEILGIVEEL